MNPRLSGRRKATFRWRSSTITTTIIITTASIADIMMSPASSWYRPGTVVTVITITTITIITASTAATIEAARDRMMRNGTVTVPFFLSLIVAGFFLRGAMQMPVGAVEYGIGR